MTNSIKNGFKMTGIFPFVANSVDYTKIAKRLDASTAIETPTTLSASFHIIFFESCIDPSILEQFKKADDY